MTATMIAVGFVAFGVDLRLETLPGLVLALVAGTACFTTLALGLARFVPDVELARPLAIGIILPLSVISGQFFPLDDAPAWLNHLASALPVKAMTDAIQYAFDPRTQGPGINGGDLLTLALWTIVGIRLTTGLFRSLSRGA
jgi:ABC-2 type transport system permease protein